MTSNRSFPLSPRSTSQLEAGDIIAVPREPTGWACLVVVEVQRRGPGARSTFIAGVVDWLGESPPREQDVAELPVVAQGLTRMEIFTEGGLAVVGNLRPVTTQFDSNYRDFHVGNTHRVWGWRTAIRQAQTRGASRAQ